jgi:hypothetical protein
MIVKIKALLEAEYPNFRNIISHPLEAIALWDMGCKEF